MSIKNLWVQKSVELATQRDYLDQLFRVYPMSVNLKRELATDVQEKIRYFLAEREGKKLLQLLLKQEIFPIKDSYVAYLRHDCSAIERNPATVNRLSGALIEMGFENILRQCTQPKETNRQIGPLFKQWLSRGSLGVPCTAYVDEFLDDDSKDMIFNASDDAMKRFAIEYLGYTHNKGLDFIGRFNTQYVIAEAKFLSDFGGHQNAQFNDAITTLRSPLRPTSKQVHTIAILDGVVYIPGKNKMFTNITNTPINETIVSAVLLRDYLYSL